MGSYIYVIGREEGPVKVGISDNPGARVLGLQTGCPFQLALLATFHFDDRMEAFREEQMFHRCYEEKRLIGEWFDIEAEYAIEGVQTGLDISEHFREMEEQAKFSDEYDRRTA